MSWCDSPSRLLADWHFSTSAEMPAGAARHIGWTYAPLRPEMWYALFWWEWWWTIKSAEICGYLVFKHTPFAFLCFFAGQRFKGVNLPRPHLNFIQPSSKFLTQPLQIHPSMAIHIMVRFAWVTPQRLNVPAGFPSLFSVCIKIHYYIYNLFH